MAENKRLIRFSMLIKRCPSLSEDEFQEYWTNTHGPIVKEWLARHGVIKYTQVGLAGRALHAEDSCIRAPTSASWLYTMSFC